MTTMVSTTITMLEETMYATHWGQPLEQRLSSLLII